MFTEQTFTVNVNDLNEAPTTLTIGASDVDENVVANTAIGNFNTAGDPDTTPQTYTYSLVAGAGDTDNASFTIVGDALQINASPDFETKASYDIRVRTTDQGGLFTEQTFTVNVNDLNEAPTTLTIGASDVDENVVANTAIGNFNTAGDPDTTPQTYTYSLVAGAGDTDNASFTIVGDALQINASPDFETKASYDIRVRTTDQGGLFTEQIFTVSVNDLNEAPTVSLANSVTVMAQNRDTSSRIQVADIVVADDALGVNALSLSGADAAMFEIDSGVLYLKAGATLSNASNPVLDVTVRS